MLRRVALIAILLVAALLIASPSIIHSRRVAHFESVCRVVARQGGRLSFDLQGDYWLTLTGVAATDEAIQALLPHLHTLPSGSRLLALAKDGISTWRLINRVLRLAVLLIYARYQ